MRIAVFAIITLLFPLIFLSCSGNESPSVPEPPSSPVLMINDDDRSITLSWMQSPSDVEGYRVRFESELIADVPSSQTSIVDTPEFLGTYAVSAYDENSESKVRFVTMPELNEFNYSFSLKAFEFCALRIDTLMRICTDTVSSDSIVVDTVFTPTRYIIVNYRHEYGYAENEYYADSIDLYMDSLFYLNSPQKIVEEGRWSHAFYTKFKKLGSGLSMQDFEDWKVLTPYYESDTSFVDYIKIVGEGDMLEVVTFRQNEPLHTSDKTYGLIYISQKNEDEMKVEFYLKFQKEKNFCIIGGNE
ncbi:hypothetical protein J7M00_01600 [bacterium]|nr:hypothetical protein [bacterium]